MPPTHREELDREELEIVAWRFLRSEFTEQTYSDWPMDRRVDAFLVHYGLIELMNDGSAYDVLLERIMANIGPALRNGTLSPNT